MKTDAQLKTDVMTELDWDPAINATNVGVSVKDGVVTLTGHIDTFAQTYAIEHAAQRVEGVKAVAVEPDVKLAVGHRRDDTEIAHAAEAAFPSSGMRSSRPAASGSRSRRLGSGWVGKLTGIASARKHAAAGISMVINDLQVAAAA